MVASAWWRWLGAVTAVLWLACAISVAADELGGRALEGVVLADDVVVRKGNSEGFEPRFEQPLHEGVEFRVIEQRPDWLSIELPDGKTGWIRAADAGLIAQNSIGNCVRNTNCPSFGTTSARQSTPKPRKVGTGSRPKPMSVVHLATCLYTL